MKVDVLIRNGQIIDGSGEKSYKASIAIKDGEIVILQGKQNPIAKEVIDAEGLIVSPGFIDIHTHSDLTLLADPRGASKVSQGVTTEIVGNCGFAPVPCPPEIKQKMIESTSFIYSDVVEWTWNDYRQYVDQFIEKGISINVGFYIGHGMVRAAAMGYENRKPTAEELEKMKQYVEEAMKQGALGLSSGLIYPPGVFAEQEELIELCKVVSDYGGIYSTHMRDEADYLMDSIEEAIGVARKSGVSLQISHLKASGKRNWGKITEAQECMMEARNEGINVHYDFYPYTAGSTFMTALLPNWVHEGGWEKAEARIIDSKSRKKIIQDIENGIPGWWNPAITAGWENIMIAFVQTEKNRALEGKTLQTLAEESERDPIEAMLDLLLEEQGEVGMVIFLMSEEDVQKAAAGELAMVGSDGFAIAKDGILSRSKPHPRSYGTFPRVFAKYQRQHRLFSLEKAVYKMTGLPAEKLHLQNRGLIKNGFAADLVLFDSNEMQDLATFSDPHQYSKGVRMVFVNGKKAYQEGEIFNPKSGYVVTPSLLRTESQLK